MRLWTFITMSFVNFLLMIFRVYEINGPELQCETGKKKKLSDQSQRLSTYSTLSKLSDVVKQ